MSCAIDRCAAAVGCNSHVQLTLEAAPGVDAALVARMLGELTAALAGARAASPRGELIACGALLADRFTVDHSGAADALRPDLALSRRHGAPLVLGALAATAAREAGIALGLLAGPHGRLAVAHALLAEPLVLDLDAGFALRDIAGDEPLHRWLCGHETARRIAAGLDAQPSRGAAPTGSRTRAPAPGLRTAHRRLQPHG
jgi:hypothetical protein